jgi:DNA-directed RNA polymerase beta' subunit
MKDIILSELPYYVEKSIRNGSLEKEKVLSQCNEILKHWGDKPESVERLFEIDTAKEIIQRIIPLNCNFKKDVLTVIENAENNGLQHFNDFNEKIKDYKLNSKIEKLKKLKEESLKLYKMHIDEKTLASTYEYCFWHVVYENAEQLHSWLTSMQEIISKRK